MRHHGALAWHHRFGSAVVVVLSLVHAAVASASSWTEGEKTLLYIRIDFADLPGAPVSDKDLKVILARTENFFRENSNGAYTIKWTFTPTLRMPRPASFYDGNSDQEQIIRDARAAAQKAGYDTTPYSLDIVAFRTPHGGDSEFAAVGGKGARILNNFRYGITIHAIGHNLGLPHSTFWKTTDGSIIGAGASEDYGDPYDPMGGGGNEDAALHHFVIRSKAMLGWLGKSGLTEVTASGTYRLFAQDLPTGSGVRGLHIKRDTQIDYWIEFRQLITDNPNMMNGVRVLRSYSDRNAVDLLSMNPGSPAGPGDAPLLLGHTFADVQAGIYVTPVSLNKTQPPSCDVVFNIDHAKPNAPLALHIDTSARMASPNQRITFTAHVDNPGPQPLLYSWDFGDGTFDCGRPEVSHAWASNSADYLVRGFVTDLRGQSASALQPISIGHPSTFQLFGKVSADGKPLPDVRVSIGAGDDATRDGLRNIRHRGPDSVLTDSAGQFAFVGLGKGHYLVRPARQGYYILPVVLPCPSARPSNFNAVPLIDGRGGPAGADDKSTIRLHVHATIDGKDELWITHDQAAWKHFDFGWPANIKLNAVAIDPHRLTRNSGSTAFLPHEADFASAVVVAKTGRGAIDLYRQDQALVVGFDDPDPGAGDYEMDIELKADTPGPSQR